MKSQTSLHAIGAKPLVIKCHPNRPDIVVVGFESGEVVFVNCQNMNTFSVPVSDSAKRFARGEKSEEGVPVGITELSWDPYEDNLIVSCQDGSMAMITF